MAIQKITSGIIQDGAVAAADIVSVANTAITGNIISSQIAPDQTLNGNVSVTGNTILGDATTDTLNVGAGGLVKDASGNVGIGTASPTSRLQVGDATVNTSNGIILGKYNAASEANLPAIRQISAGTGNDLAIAATSGSGAIRFYTGGADSSLDLGTASNAERARIDSSGNLLVRTTSQIAQGYISVLYSNSIGQGLCFNENSGSGLTRDAVRFQTSGTQVGAISVSTTATAYVTSSDYRLKENIAPMTGALATVSQLKPVTYSWKDGGFSGQGFIAHELAEVVPDCVAGEKDAVDAEGKPQYQGIDTSFLVATLTAAIQELKAIVDAQAVRIAALEIK